MPRPTRLIELETVDPESKEYTVIVETPKGHRNKYTYEESLDRFMLGGVLTAGAVFPYDFGFLPRTTGGDGDPLDALVLMDEPAFTGCIVRVRLIGVIQAEQTEHDGEVTRNDRLITVAAKSHEYREIEDISDLSRSLVDEIEYFFISYNQIKGKEFRPVGRHGNRTARRVVEEGMNRFTERDGREK
jgi:inorganic pyrophosphatase